MPSGRRCTTSWCSREPCPRTARELIVGNADDVVSALKCTRLRHMRRRDRLTRYLRGRIDAGEVPFALPGLLTPAEQAFYLQGAFFNTAVVQMSEAMAHLLLALAQHPGVQDGCGPTPATASTCPTVINEAMRVWPLFGIAHRITTGDIDVSPPIAAGSVRAVRLPRIPPRQRRRRGAVRPRTLGAGERPGDELHPVRGQREPSLPGPRGRAGRHAGGGLRGAAPVRAVIGGAAHAVALEPGAGPADPGRRAPAVVRRGWP